jgi:uncharacterized protein involved in outer membrane biogenesis
MSKGIERAARALLIAVAFYSLLGFLILPGIGLRIANQQLAQYANVPASVQRLQFNPFSLELNLWGLRIGETDQAPIAFERLYANLQLDSLWRGALHLEAVELDKPHGNLRFAKDGTLNLTQVFKLPASREESSATDPNRTFPLRIDRIALSGGNLHIQDLRPGEAIDLAYDDLNLELLNLSTLPDYNAELTLVASGPNGARIDWNGDLSLTPLASSGSLKISDGRLKTFWPYVRDAVPLALKDGLVNLATDYSMSMADDLKLLLNNLEIRLAPLAIATDDGRPLLKLAELDIGKTRVDLVKRQVTIGQIRSRQLEAWAAREADGVTDWQKLLTPPRAVDAAPANDAPATPSKPWQVILRDVQLRDYRIHLADPVPEQPVELEVGPLDLDLADFDSLGKSPFTLKLDTGVGKQGKLHAAGQVQLSPTSASLKVSSQGIDLRPAQAYLSPFVRLELRSGLLGSDLEVQLSSVEPLAFSVSGTAKINQLHTLDTLKGRDFLRWQQLDLLGLNYRHGDSLNIDEIQLNQPYARFIINEDLSTNVSELLVAQPVRPTNSAPSSSEAGANKPLAIRIGAVNFQDGSANFADFSLTPNFATAIQQLNGRIGTLDSQAQTPASVDIAGKVDRYAPVSIKGSLTPFDPLQRLDIRTQFKQLELTTLTPYSGKFAGYRIRKGRLSLDLHYRISQGQLNAENSVVVEQLQLGEKVDSPSAVDLPIRLAVALLKDTEGKIALSLPVSGDLKNPQFSVMPIVWKTLRNLVLRAAQAPFKFIGGLVGGSDIDLSTVHFNAGSSELDGEAQNVLDTLANALTERPTLRLEVQGVSAQGSDGLPVAEQRLQREFQRTYYRMLQRRGDTVPASASQLQVPEEEQAPLLEGIYRTRLKQQPPAQWQELNDEERANKLREGLLSFWAKSTSLQRRLAQARAAEVKGYLVDRGGLQDSRVYLLDASLGQADANGRVATQLQLDSE